MDWSYCTPISTVAMKKASTGHREAYNKKQTGPTDPAKTHTHTHLEREGGGGGGSTFGEVLRQMLPICCCGIQSRKIIIRNCKIGTLSGTRDEAVVSGQRCAISASPCALCSHHAGTHQAGNNSDRWVPSCIGGRGVHERHILWQLNFYNSTPPPTHTHTHARTCPYTNDATRNLQHSCTQ